MGLLIIYVHSKLPPNEPEASELVQDAASCRKRVKFMKTVITKVFATSPDCNFGILKSFTDNG
jgi:hypothetical protein